MDLHTLLQLSYGHKQKHNYHFEVEQYNEKLEIENPQHNAELKIRNVQER